MNSNHSRRAPKERGQTLIVFVLFFGILAGFTAMAIDMGIFYHDRRQFQNSADAMALAGVAELPVNPALAQQKAQDWATNNNVDPSEIKTIQVRTTGYPNDTLYVELEGEFDWIFARVLGMTTDNVGADAAARTGSLAGGHDMMPWALLQGDTDCLDSNGDPIFGADCVVKVGHDSIINGWRGALDVDGSGGGSNEYGDNIIDGTTDWLYCISGQDPPPCHGIVDALDGNKVGGTGHGIDERMAQGAQCDTNGNGKDDFGEVFEPTGLASPEYTVACPDSPRLIIIPIVSYESTPVQEVTIRGWSLAYLEGYGCYPDASSANLSERTVVFGGRSIPAGGSAPDIGVLETGPSKPCHHNKGAAKGETQLAEDAFVMAIEPGAPITAALRGPAAPPACHAGVPHGQQTCPTPTPTPAPTPSPTPTPAPTTPTPAPTSTPTPAPSSTPGPTPSSTPGPLPSSDCANGKGHWEVEIDIVDAAYSQSAGFLGVYDAQSGIIVRRLIQ